MLAKRTKTLLSRSISHNQTAYSENRFISEGCRLISDILEVTKTLKFKSFLLTIDIEKAFDLVDHLFIFHVLEKFRFGKNFIKWIEILLTNQESGIPNGGKSSKYFILKKRTRQGDPIFTYLSF